MNDGLVNICNKECD